MMFERHIQEKRKHKDKDHSGSNDNFTYSCFEYDDGPYIDMDFTTSPTEDNKDSNEEFEFSISISAEKKAQIVWEEGSNCISPADELFYKGKLLPLHLPPRLQMVRNLSMSRGSDSAMNASPETLTLNESSDIHCTSSSNKEPISHKHQSHSILKSATKFKVFLFGFKKSSKVGNDDHHHSSNYSPNHPRFTIKFKSMKTPVQFFTKNRSTKSQKSPDYSSNSPSAKHVLQKYLRMVKHIMSQRRVDSVDDQHVQVENEYGCPFGESGRRIQDSFSGNLKMGSRHFGFRSCPSSIDSSPNHDGVQTSFYSDVHQSAVQAAIAHCKQSNGIIGSTLRIILNDPIIRMRELRMYQRFGSYSYQHQYFGSYSTIHHKDKRTKNIPTSPRTLNVHHSALHPVLKTVHHQWKLRMIFIFHW